MTDFKILTTCALLMAGAGPRLCAQQAPFNRVIHVTVTDPINRFVTGLEQAYFDITENGIQRPIMHFSNVDSPIAFAIVGIVAPPDVLALKRPEDELFQTQSIPDALRELATATNSRKALILNSTSDAQEVPEGIQVLKTGEGNLFKAVIEARNCYSLGFSSSDRSSMVEVILKQPRGLPRLKLIKK